MTERTRLTPLSALARLGYWYATLVGILWGSMWSTGKIERRNGLIVFRGMPRWTFGRGGSCVGACYLTNQNVSDGILQHEAVHKTQWQRYGLLLPVLYAWAGRNPLKNRFEIEAGLELGGYVRPRRASSPAARAAQAAQTAEDTPTGTPAHSEQESATP